MKSLVMSALLIVSGTISAKSFRSLSSAEAIEINEVSETEGYKNIHLLVVKKNNNFSQIPLRLETIINNDTIIDFITLEDNIRGNVKTVFLNEGDSVKARLLIQNPSEIEVEKLKGNISFKEPMLLATSSTPISKTLIGNYWDVKQTCMFRIQKNDTVAEKLSFNFEFDENYLYDQFHFQVNIISPDSAFKSSEESLIIQTGDSLNFYNGILTSKQEVEINIPGKYIIELVPMMNKRRINGIKSVGYKLVKK